MSNAWRETTGFAAGISSSGAIRNKMGARMCGAQRPAWNATGVGGVTRVAQFNQFVP